MVSDEEEAVNDGGIIFHFLLVAIYWLLIKVELFALYLLFPSTTFTSATLPATCYFFSATGYVRNNTIINKY